MFVENAEPRHPKGTNATILLTSVFGPYARDDKFGSRKRSIMELFHNQITREQGPFSLRASFRSYGLILISVNVNAPCVLLDFPNLKRFILEIKTHAYDIIGIGSILMNLYKVQYMCRLIRRYNPCAKIVVGDGVAWYPGVESIIDADFFIKGDGVCWFRRYLGQDESEPIIHPITYTNSHERILGISIPDKIHHTPAAIMPTLGCPKGCDFCFTSASFGGKGKFIKLIDSGDELFLIMCRIEKKLKNNMFFIFDENFLLYRKIVLRLIDLMERYHKSWDIQSFASADAITSYSIDQLVALGLQQVWIGLEGKNSPYNKLKGIDTRALIRTLQANGICIIGSTIIGMEDQTPENIDTLIDWAVAHHTDFHQFMLYMAFPGTPLYERYKKEKRLLPETEFSTADAHGQYRFNYRHDHFQHGEEEDILTRAFKRDFETNGPGLATFIQTNLKGYIKYKHDPNPRIRKRFARRWMTLAIFSPGVIWATRHWFRNNQRVAAKMDGILACLYAEFGLISKICAPVLGRLFQYTIKNESERLDHGWIYEPPTFYEKNAHAKRHGFRHPVNTQVAALRENCH